MYTLFYLLAYVAVLGFICLAFLKMRDFVKDSPLHIRWELYPVPHEGPKKAAYGGSYMEESNWWTKPRHVDHWMDIKAMLMEIIFLEATYKNNPKLWARSYPFHMGLYLLMGGTIVLLFAAFLQICGLSPHNGFIIFLGNIINAISMSGGFLIAAGGIALIMRRIQDKGLKRYTTKEMFFNLGGFSLFGILTLLAWVFNPSYYAVANKFMTNLLTFNFSPLGSTWFVLSMLVGFVMLLWIPVTNMKHLLIKYFMYHDIRWGDEATVYSERNQKLIEKELQFDVTWSAPHIAGDGGTHTWAEVATTDSAAPKKD